ncbi:hypothetical protein BDV24DRAFT_158022 [Aspergillus arachidicola]|uniref:NADP-dependent oxidoreductase domain-containing protein n=1 Tax=Aspergillus arachidicola TaxID=656916 RepID=A0A5N6YPB4_9EURO|nr:hypothetical protein BDV24DRAFT_158022 [Aspergillus arachidicola]
MQNTRLERYGIPALKEAQVPVICNSSPLASGLLRASGVPMGTLGDWHPSPNGLPRATRASQNGVSVHTILGICSIKDIEENVRAVRSILLPEASTGDGLKDGNVNVLRLKTVNEAVEQRDRVLSRTVRQILGDWAEYDFNKGQTKQDARSWWPAISAGVLVCVLVMGMSFLLFSRSSLSPFFNHVRS